MDTTKHETAKVQIPSVGRIVHYKLTAGDVVDIAQCRAESTARVGNAVTLGDVLPAVVVRLFDPSVTTVNLQVLLDGNDTYWATSRQHGYGPGQWHWPERV